ncbi:glycosyltransferase family 2 protein [Nioella nitratireducens]|uniref:glycosyltransferase family 2 protein n=1 Tax=Nioella nitratireducens TaxID=1287720 RepID=UPI0008FD770F|nr:glycosyltransferase [Nioella nitratireducens]
MTQPPPVSVIVVSHGRPALLRRALIGIGQLFYRPFEVVVVADRSGLGAIADLPFADRLKTAEQQSPNISAARNAGAALAGGDILAFIDDDAVPEPTWLHHLVSKMSEPGCAAATGTVLGRNGISVQWADRWVDATGVACPAAPGPVPDGMAVKLEGTNMAVRRDVLADLGGFDEAFAFFLDETDLAWRLKEAGQKIAFAPLATVHHGYAESTRRRADRVPLDLRPIGASAVHYLAKHASAKDRSAALATLRAEQVARLDGWVAQKRLTKQERAALLAGLDAGMAEGAAAPILRDIPPATPFRPFHEAPSPAPLVLSGRWFNHRRLTRQAHAAAAQGVSVSLFLFDHTVRAQKVQFQPPGVWIQTGGLFGPSQRDNPRFQLWTFRQRVRAEQARLAKIRWI